MFACLLLTALSAGAPRPKEERKVDPDPPVGSWEVQRAAERGREIEAVPAGLIFRFTPDTKTVVFTGHGLELSTAKAGYFVAGGVRQVDLIYPSDPTKTRLGIWKVDGDTMTLCEGEIGAARPTDFSVPEGSGRALYVLKRVKK
jgi:hypothetical protein